MMHALKKSIVILLIVCLGAQLINCRSPGESFEKARNKAGEWLSSLCTERFYEGFEYAFEYMNIESSALMTSEYIQNIETAIANLKESMNSAAGSARKTAQEAGFVAEKWVASTFNINSAANNSLYTAEVKSSNGLGSVDVSTNYGEDAGLKFYRSADASANAQAKSVLKAYKEYSLRSQNPKSLEEYLESNEIDTKTKEAMYKSIYDGQTRIIPTEQLSEAIRYLQGQIDKLSKIDGEAVSLQNKTYQETMEKLRDRLLAPDGTQSKPLTYEEAQAIAELSQKGEFEPEDFGVTLPQVVNYRMILKQAIGTGLDVGALKTVFEVGPDLFSIIIEASKTGNIDEYRLKEVGVDGAIAMTGGFVEGSISSTVVSLCASGSLGKELMCVSPSIVAALTFLIIEAAINGCELAKGKITKEEYGDLMADRIMITLLMIPTSAMVVSILPASKLAVLAGCMAGGMLMCTAYGAVKEAIMEFADAGGIVAIVPKNIVDSASSAHKAIKERVIFDLTSSFGMFVIKMYDNGYIRVKEA